MTWVTHLHLPSSDCSPDHGTEAVWPLIGLTRWVLALMEKVMQECVKSCDMHLLEIATGFNSDHSTASPSTC